MDLQSIGNIAFAVLGAGGVYLGQFLVGRLRGRLGKRSEV